MDKPTMKLRVGPTAATTPGAAMGRNTRRMIRQVSWSVAVATLEEILPMGAECHNPSAFLPASFTHASSSSSSLAPPPGAGGGPAAARAGAAASAAAARKTERTVEIFETARAH